LFKEFFKELIEGRLIGLKCEECGYVTCPPKSTCDKCRGKKLKRVQLSGKGRIVSYTTTYVAPMGYEKETPYVVAMVELDEGCWILGRLDVDPERAEKDDLIGKRVEVYGKEFPSEIFYPDREKRIVPMFRIIE